MKNRTRARLARSMSRWRKPSLNVQYDTQIIVSATTFMAPLHDQAINIAVRDLRLLHLCGRRFQFGLPELLLQPIELSAELQELAGIESRCRLDNLLNR